LEGVGGTLPTLGNQASGAVLTTDKTVRLDDVYSLFTHNQYH